MTRTELTVCIACTLIIGVVVGPLAMFAVSGHANVSAVLALTAMLFLLPAIIGELVFRGAGDLPAAIAAVGAEFACIFALVYLVRRRRRRKKHRFSDQTEA